MKGVDRGSYHACGGLWNSNPRGAILFFYNLSVGNSINFIKNYRNQLTKLTNKDILEASEKIKRILLDKRERAIASLRIFILGSYEEEGKDKEVLLKFQSKLHEFGVKAFLMEDLMPKEKDYKRKFDAIWDFMKQAPNPFFILFAGKSAENSQGFLSELVDIANDKNKLDVAHLFMIKGVKLPHHAECYLNCHEVPDNEMFEKSAYTLIKKKIANIENFLDTIDN